MPATASKRRTNVTIDRDLLEAARGLGLNVSGITESALAQAVREAKAKAWAEENAEAIAEQGAWIEANGTPLARWQVWKP
jgi:antitoxin CcdA